MRSSTSPPRHLLRSLALVTLLSLSGTEDLLASTYYVRSLSSASMLHRQRLDTTIRAPRLLNQGLELHAFELLDAPLHAHTSFRFRHDLTTPFDTPLQLDLLYLRWQPISPLSLSVGRQWIASSLGFRDLDGVDLAMRITPGVDLLTARLDLFAGRPVFQSTSWLAPSTFDVQGLPLYNDPEERSDRDRQLLVGGSITLSTPQRALLLQTSYQRRVVPSLDLEAEERAGASLTVEPGVARRARTDAHLVYNALLRRAERIELQQRVDLGRKRDELFDAPPTSISFAVARRRPWFDASSIFNLFDPSPHDDLALGLGHRISPHLALHAKVWARAYHGDTSFTDWLSPSNQDARTLGAHLTQSSSIPFQAGRHDLLISLDTLASTQHTSPRSSLYPSQWLLDQRVDLALRSPRSPSLFTRHLLLHTNAHTPRTLDRPQRASATSHLLGVDTQQLFRARLSLQLEYRTGTSTLSSFNVYTMLTLAERR